MFLKSNPNSHFFSDDVRYKRYRQRIANAEENLLDRMDRKDEPRFYEYMSKFVKERDELRRLEGKNE
jgi:hypothetical protein